MHKQNFIAEERVYKHVFTDLKNLIVYKSSAILREVLPRYKWFQILRSKIVEYYPVT